MILKYELQSTEGPSYLLHVISAIVIMEANFQFQNYLLFIARLVIRQACFNPNLYVYHCKKILLLL